MLTCTLAHMFEMNCNSVSKGLKPSPAVRMQSAVRNLMEIQGLWEDILSCDIPKSWEKYGDLLLFNGEKYFRDSRWMQADGLWQCICYVMKVKRVALKHNITDNAFRSPKVALVHGSNTWVEFRDNGITYCWDVLCNMFCAGNAPERHRISSLQCEGEVVVDMYAGIGYFTLPYLVKAKAKIVHACEWNPKAIAALKLNLNKNKVANRCVIYEGDCTLMCPKQLADRVNLGLLPSSEPGWKSACEALKPLSGGTLLIHENVVSGLKIAKDVNHLLPCETCKNIIHSYDPSEITMSENKFLCQKQLAFALHHSSVTVEMAVINWRRTEWKIWALHVCHQLRDIFFVIYPERNWKTMVCNLHHVKSYAPHIDHLVLDVKCTPLEYSC